MPLPTNLTTLEGTHFPASEIEGKVLLFVNVASQCGLTPQYSGLVELDKKYASRGFKVVSVPFNQFGAQESSSLKEIKKIRRVNTMLSLLY